MSDYPPILGFDDRDYTPTTIKWKDGSVLGILSLPPADPVVEARLEAERQRNEQIRRSDNVVLLSDYLEKSK